MNGEVRSNIAAPKLVETAAVGLKVIWQDLAKLPQATQKLKYSHLFQQALSNIYRAPLTASLTLVTVTFALFVLAAFLLFIQNIKAGLLGSQKSQIVTVYMHSNATIEHVKSLANKLSSDSSVEAVRIIDKEQALNDFRQQLAEQAEILTGLEANNPLPHSIEVSFKSELISESTYKRFSNTYGDLPLVEYIQYSHSLVEQIGSVLNIFRLTGGVALALLFLVTTFIITNTIKLALFAHREEIEIMRLVGATDSHIRAPFLLEGVIQGLSGAMLSLIGLYIAYTSLGTLLSASKLTEIVSLSFHFLSPLGIILVILLGVAVGFIGSWLAVRKFSVD